MPTFDILAVLAQVAHNARHVMPNTLTSCLL